MMMEKDREREGGVKVERVMVPGVLSRVMYVLVIFIFLI